jgi:cytoskeleton protein RodZ
MTRSDEAAQISGFGDYLRREREMRGVSLQEISEATKISIRFLEAIESEDMTRLPGGIFTRSFVRTYARYLGLDEERVLADCQLAGQNRPEVDIRRIVGNRSRPQGMGSRARFITLFVAVLLLISGYLLFRYSRRMIEQRSSTAPATAAGGSMAAASTPLGAAPPQPSQTATSTLPESNPAPSAASSAPSNSTPTATTSATPPGGAPSPAGATNTTNPVTTPDTSSAVAPNTDLVLQVAATDRVWIAIEADGKTVLQRVLDTNEVVNLKAHTSFDVTVGNAQGLVLTMNGETLKPMGRRGEVKRIHLTHDDLKNAIPER